MATVQGQPGQRIQAALAGGAPAAPGRPWPGRGLRRYGATNPSVAYYYVNQNSRTSDINTTSRGPRKSGNQSLPPLQSVPNFSTNASLINISKGASGTPLMPFSTHMYCCCTCPSCQAAGVLMSNTVSFAVIDAVGWRCQQFMRGLHHTSAGSPEPVWLSRAAGPCAA